MCFYLYTKIYTGRRSLYSTNYATRPCILAKRVFYLLLQLSYFMICIPHQSSVTNVLLKQGCNLWLAGFAKTFCNPLDILSDKAGILRHISGFHRSFYTENDRQIKMQICKFKPRWTFCRTTQEVVIRHFQNLPALHPLANRALIEALLRKKIKS